LLICSMLSSLHLLTLSLSPSLHLLTLSGLDFFQPAHHEEALPQFCRIQFRDWTINWAVLLGDFWPCPEDPGAGACLRFSNGLPKWHLLFCSSGLVTPAHFCHPFCDSCGFSCMICWMCASFSYFSWETTKRGTFGCEMWARCREPFL